MNNKHTPHRSPRIIPHPLIPIPKIRPDPRIRVRVGDPCNHVFYQGIRIRCRVLQFMMLERGGDDFCEFCGLKVVKPGLRGTEKRGTLTLGPPSSFIPSSRNRTPNTHTNAIQPQTNRHDKGQQDAKARQGPPSSGMVRVMGFPVSASWMGDGQSGFARCSGGTGGDYHCGWEGDVVRGEWEGVSGDRRTSRDTVLVYRKSERGQRKEKWFDTLLEWFDHCLLFIT